MTTVYKSFFLLLFTRCNHCYAVTLFSQSAFFQLSITGTLIGYYDYQKCGQFYVITQGFSLPPPGKFCVNLNFNETCSGECWGINKLNEGR